LRRAAGSGPAAGSATKQSNFKVALDCFAIARNDEPSFVTTGLDPVVHAELQLGMDCRII
jgi:hypothetical protein